MTEIPLVPGKRFKATKFIRLKIDGDLTRPMVEDAIESHRGVGFAPRLLIVPEQSAFDAGEIAAGLGLEVLILPKEIMPNEYSWAVASDYYTVWSPGA